MLMYACFPGPLETSIFFPQTAFLRPAATRLRCFLSPSPGVRVSNKSARSRSPVRHLSLFARSDKLFHQKNLSAQALEAAREIDDHSADLAETSGIAKANCQQDLHHPRDKLSKTHFENSTPDTRPASSCPGHANQQRILRQLGRIQSPSPKAQILPDPFGAKTSWRSCGIGHC